MYIQKTYNFTEGIVLEAKVYHARRQTILNNYFYDKLIISEEIFIILIVNKKFYPHITIPTLINFFVNEIKGRERNHGTELIIWFTLRVI